MKGKYNEVIVEPGVPVPDRTRISAAKRIVDTMNSGDSVLLDRIGSTLTFRKHIKERGMKPIVRAEGDKFRVWAM
jgi:hypothetical protein